MNNQKNIDYKSGVTINLCLISPKKLIELFLSPLKNIEFNKQNNCLHLWLILIIILKCNKFLIKIS